MTTTRFVIEDKVEGFNGDLLVFCVYQAKEGEGVICHDPVEKHVQKAVELGDFSGKEEETLVFYPLDGMELNLAGANRVMVLGLGDPSEEKEPGGVRDLFRRAGGVIAKQCEKLKALTLMVTLPETEFLEPGQVAECLVEGICLGDYRFVKYKKEKSKEREYPGLNQIALAPGKTDHGVLQRGMDLGRTAAMAACKARDMANEPGNAWTAGAFAEFARSLAEPHSLGCRILNKGDMERLGMGGILAVNRGSDEPPKMVVVEYLPENRSETILLVGK
ncbi:MAG: M17 family peptidase N-terminal domain-containing protein, partial [Desulfobacterium sp.]|nr:M17 family peptidase N-terminal domain-containing protein [Desulfobacterium sp.]